MTQTWRVAVESIQDKLHKSFEKYMATLQYMGAVQLRQTGMFMDWGMWPSVRLVDGCRVDSRIPQGNNVIMVVD